MVLVLNRGEVISAEAEAMLQALHSRSVGGIKMHLRKLARTGPAGFMGTYYVGYGDKSIGDCGSATIFVEGVSMLVAKAIQDCPLYNGQESSTRYIDFSSQPFINPIGTDFAREHLERWRAFYLASQEPVRAHLNKLYPPQIGEDVPTYDKAIRARAFDITRGFLPAGASTNLAWHGELRILADHLMVLRHHPLREVRVTAEWMLAALMDAHPNSFNQKRYPATEAYNDFWMDEFYYFRSERRYEGVELLRDTMDYELLGQYREALVRRPAKAELPKFMRECGTMQFGFMLDYGSFRDAQRNRAVVQRMPLLTMEHGFGNWYLESLPASVRRQAVKLLRDQKKELCLMMEKSGRGAPVAQYYIPMGYEIPNRLTGDLPGLVWFAELRSTRFIHPTLQVKAARMAEIMLEKLGGSGLVLHLDKEPGRFDIRRGAHDIVERS
jgi:thymidylate synthase ThyX